MHLSEINVKTYFQKKSLTGNLSKATIINHQGFRKIDRRSETIV
jgi:hypothetical protein